MYLSELYIENFRTFGTGDSSLWLEFQKGLNALVGENDSGKTAVIDAIRVILGTRDNQKISLSPGDFHVNAENTQAKHLVIRITFRHLSDDELAAFAEYLTYSDSEAESVLQINLRATYLNDRIKAVLFAGKPVGSNGLGEIDRETRERIRATYLQPLRNAEREMDIGRNSRISKILRSRDSINKGNNDFKLADVGDKAFSSVIDDIGIIGIAKMINELLEKHESIKETSSKINKSFLSPLQMVGDQLVASIGVGPQVNDDVLMRQMLEKISIALDSKGGVRGLGSNNLLFIACELLLLTTSKDELGLLLVEEPEAHLHPQRQLRLIQYLNSIISNEDSIDIQVIVSTHSPTLASKLPVGSMILMKNGKAMPLVASGLKGKDFNFLERFLDATKSNLFFCRGLIVVEGDAENLLLPYLARLLNKDLTENGISIVNVGHTGLHRYAKIFNGSKKYKNPGINVGCLHDLDLVNLNAAMAINHPKSMSKDKCKLINEVIESHKDQVDELIVEVNKLIPQNVITELEGDENDSRKKEVKLRNRYYDGVHVKGFYSSPWTLEYSLAFGELSEDLVIAACLAKSEESSKFEESKHYSKIQAAAKFYYSFLIKEYGNNSTYGSLEVVAAKIYELFLRSVSIKEVLESEGLVEGSDEEEGLKLILSKKASKAVAAQYLGELLEKKNDKMKAESTSDVEVINYWKKVIPLEIQKLFNHVLGEIGNE